MQPARVLGRQLADLVELLHFFRSQHPLSGDQIVGQLLGARDSRALQRLSGDLLRQNLRVNVGGFDEVDSRVDRLTDETLGVRLLEVPDLTLHAVSITEGLGAQAPFRNKQAGLAE